MALVLMALVLIWAAARRPMALALTVVAVTLIAAAVAAAR